jgi:tetratricopeptide (TPR) repeat protein
LAQLSAQAVEAQRAGDYRAAAAIYKQILERQPHSPEVRSNLALMYHLLGNYKEAVSTFEIALRDAPQLYVANLFLGLDLLTLKQPQRALGFLERACRLNKQDAQAQIGLARAYEALGNTEKAKDAYERAAQIDPQSSDAWYGLGTAYLSLQEAAVDRLAEAGRESPYAHDLVAHSLLEQRRPDAAVNIYRDLLKSKQTLPCLGAQLGFAYIQAEDFQSAEGAFHIEGKERPGCLLARFGLARLSLEHHNTDETLSELYGIWTSDQNFFKENLPTFWASLNAEAFSLLKKSCDRISGSQQKVLFGQFLASAIHAGQAESYEPLSASAIISPGNAGKPTPSVEVSPLASASPEALLSQGRYTECDRSLQARLARLGPSELKTLCECAYYSGDFRTTFLAGGELAKHPSDILPSQYWRAKSAERLGVAALRQTSLVAPDSPGVHFVLAELYHRRYEDVQSAAEYRKVIELQPNDLAAHVGLAGVYIVLFPTFDKAIAELKLVLSLDPNHPGANYLMGAILVSMHRFSEAMPYLEIALKGSTAMAPRVHALISKVYASQGRTTEAIGELRQALGTDEDGSLHYQLAQLYRKVGDQKAAADAMKQAQAMFAEKTRHTPQVPTTASDSDSKATSAGGDVDEAPPQ